MNGLFHSFRFDRSGTSAAEFALVLPLMLLFLLGMIDVGRYGWAFNKMEKAAQMGARMAVVTYFVAPNIATQNYVELGVPQGDTIPVDMFGVMICSSTKCDCPGDDCPRGDGPDFSQEAFNNIAKRVKQIDPTIADANIFVEYRGSGLGFAGDPNGSDIAPLTTVRVSGMQFQPITTPLFAAAFPLPTVSHTLTMEDGAGVESN